MYIIIHMCICIYIFMYIHACIQTDIQYYIDISHYMSSRMHPTCSCFKPSYSWLSMGHHLVENQEMVWCATDKTAANVVKQPKLFQHGDMLRHND